MHDGLTAAGLLEAAAARPGERVLITAAAGGMGVLLVQALVRTGATVVGAARGDRKLALIEQHGARAIDYEAPGWAQRAEALAGGPFAAVLDGVGGGVGRQAFTRTAAGGRFFAHGAAAVDFAPITEQEAASRQVELRGIQHVQFSPTTPVGSREQRSTLRLTTAGDP